MANIRKFYFRPDHVAPGLNDFLRDRLPSKDTPDGQTLIGDTLNFISTYNPEIMLKYRELSGGSRQAAAAAGGVSAPQISVTSVEHVFGGAGGASSGASSVLPRATAGTAAGGASSGAAADHPIGVLRVAVETATGLSATNLQSAYDVFTKALASAPAFPGATTDAPAMSTGLGAGGWFSGGERDFHTMAPFWPKERLDEYFRSNLLPSLTFALTGVITSGHRILNVVPRDAGDNYTPLRQDDHISDAIRSFYGRQALRDYEVKIDNRDYQMLKILWLSLKSGMNDRLRALIMSQGAYRSFFTYLPNVPEFGDMYLHEPRYELMSGWETPESSSHYPFKLNRGEGVPDLDVAILIAMIPDVLLEQIRTYVLHVNDTVIRTLRILENDEKLLRLAYWFHKYKIADESLRVNPRRGVVVSVEAPASRNLNSVVQNIEFLLEEHVRQAYIFAFQNDGRLDGFLPQFRNLADQRAYAFWTTNPAE